MNLTFSWLWNMDLGARLVVLRKQRGLSQQAMADAVGVHVNQIKRYEAGAAQPSLEALKKLARALHVTTDSLLFEDAERGPNEELRLHFEAIVSMPEEEQALAKAMLEAIILKNQVSGAVRGLSATPAAKGKKSARERARA